MCICIRCMYSRDNSYTSTSVTPEQQSRNLPNTTELELPRYEEAVNMPRSVEVSETDIGVPETEEGLGKVKLGEESPPHYEVAKKSLD